MPGRTSARVRGAFFVVTSKRRSVLRVAALLATGLVLAGCSNSASTAVTTTTESAATLLFTSGLAAVQQARYQQAITDFGAVLQLQPRSYVAAYDLGVADTGLKRTFAAEAAYRRALSVAPTYRSALYNLALLYSTTDPDEAINLFAKLETIHPGDPNVEFNYGLVLEHVGQVKAGEAQLTAALKADPSLRQDLPKGTILPKGG